MEKIAADKQIDRQDGIKIAAAGFATALGSPATELKPTDVKDLTASFVKKANKRSARHDRIVGIVREHAKG